MDIQQSKNFNTGTLNTEGGNAHLGDNFYKSLEYKELTERIEEMRDFMQSTTDEVKRLKYSQKLNELQAQLDAFKRDITKLYETFQNTNLDNEIIKLAKQKFDDGKLKEARSLLEAEQITNGFDVLIQRKEKLKQDFKDKADELLLLAQLTAVDYDMPNRAEKAKEYFEKSLKASQNIHNLSGFARFLHLNKEYDLSEKYYSIAWDEYSKLDDEHRDKHPEVIAAILNNLATIDAVNGRFADAKAKYNAIIELYEALYKREKDRYGTYLIGALNNLGTAFRETGDIQSAFSTYKKALKLYRCLGDDISDNLKSESAMVFSNMGIICERTGNTEKAAELYNEGIRIQKEFVERNPLNLLFKSDLSILLHNKGYLHKKKGEYNKALADFGASFCIRKDLSNKNPLEYLPYLGKTLEALSKVHAEMDNTNIAEEKLLKSLKIFENAVSISAKEYKGDLARVYVYAAVFYQKKKTNKSKSLDFVDFAIKILQPYSHQKDVQQELMKVFKVLRDWHISPETFAKRVRNIVD